MDDRVALLDRTDPRNLPNFAAEGRRSDGSTVKNRLRIARGRLADTLGELNNSLAAIRRVSGVNDIEAIRGTIRQLEGSIETLRRLANEIGESAEEAQQDYDGWNGAVGRAKVEHWRAIKRTFADAARTERERLTAVVRTLTQDSIPVMTGANRALNDRLAAARG
jgi:hypothetical protein